MPELVSTAYERSDEAPTQLSILTWMSLRVMRADVALNDFLSTVTLVMVPGRGSTSNWPLMPAVALPNPRGVAAVGV